MNEKQLQEFKHRRIELIVRSSMGMSYDWEKPKIAQTVGPYYPKAFDEYTQNYPETKLKIQQKLGTLDVDELAQGFQENGHLNIAPNWVGQFGRC